jgi:uncharacterized protein (DUF58 family)
VNIGRVLLILFLLFLFLFFPVYLIQWFSLLFAGLLLLSYAYTAALSRGLRVRRRFTRLHCYRHQDTVSELIVENRSIFPVHYLTLVDTTGSLFTGGSERVLLSLKAREKRYIEITLKGYNRGEYRLGPVRVRFSDPLGLFPRLLSLPVPGTVVIYPQVYPLLLEQKRGLPSGNITVNNPIYEDISRYRSIREYESGDDPRKINWKVSARLGKLFTMEYLPSIYYPVFILLNLTAEDYPERRRYRFSERAVETAAGLVKYCVDLGQNTGLLSTGLLKDESESVYIPIQGGGGSHGTVIMDALARIQINAHGADCIGLLFDTAALPYGCRLMYVGPPLPRERLRSLASRVKGSRSAELFYVGWKTRHRDEELPGFGRPYLVAEYGALGVG